MLKKITVFLLLSSVLSTAQAGLPDASKLQALKQGLQKQLDAFKLVKNSSGQCLALDMANVKISGSTALLQNCTGKPNQRWSIRNGIISNPAKLCIQPVKNDKGETLLQAMTCTGKPHQIWQIVTNPDKRIEIRKDKQCLGVVSRKNGFALALEPCVAKNANQKWTHQ
ncbi:MAG: hypothetical protein CSA50_00120 [Gammaproteobacteria bacterium]|nr:MAG: hypothetical protein CSA50_00120 [Gammaproteobacteria bacterium]